MDPILRNNQNGFRANRGTTEHILAIRRLVEEESIVKDRLLVITFIDFKKAFDYINRSRMIKILQAYGVSEIVADLISVMYDGTTAAVRTNDGTSNTFDINAGVLQGDTLAPFLFVWVVDYILRRAVEETGVGYTLTKRNGSREAEVKICDLDFADDVALLTNSISDAQILLTAVEKYAAEVGLFLNPKKTEIMISTGGQKPDLAAERVVSADGSVIKVVDDFKYLGAWISDSKKDINVRIGQAWSAITRMHLIWRSQMELGLKRRFFSATVVSILLYGCETWSMTKNCERKLDGAYTKLLRYASGVHWSDHITNAVLYGDLPKISLVIKRRRLRFAGHCIRAIHQPVSQLVLRQPISGFRRGGASVLTYPKVIQSDLYSTNLFHSPPSYDHIIHDALDRTLNKNKKTTWQHYINNIH